MSTPSQFAMFRWLVRRDLTLAWRRRADALSTLFFFVIVVSLFPLSIGPDTQLLRSIASGLVWVAALLASMLSLGRLFAGDYVDGTLEQMLMTPQPLYLIVLGKAFAQWLVSEVPLILITPLVGTQFGWTRSALLLLVVSLVLGIPVFSLIGSAGAAEASLASGSPEANLYLLGAVLVSTVVFAPWATSAALRISLE